MILNLPHSNKLGTIINSRIFITAIIMIWRMVLTLGFTLLNIQMDIPISANPIVKVKGLAYSSPSIRPTISWCLGTRFKTLQMSPLMSQTKANRYLSMV